MSILRKPQSRITNVDQLLENPLARRVPDGFDDVVTFGTDSVVEEPDFGRGSRALEEPLCLQRSLCSEQELAQRAALALDAEVIEQLSTGGSAALCRFLEQSRPSKQLVP